MIRRLTKDILTSLLFIFGLFALLQAAIIIRAILFPVCDVHGENSSLSPDGIWRATWSTEGCSAFLLTTYFHSKVIVSKAIRPIKASYVVFKSDSPYNVTFTWPERNALHIEVPRITDITLSKRNFPGLSVSYGVPKSALRDLAMRLKYDERQIALLRRKAVFGTPPLSLADRKAEEKNDENDRRYLGQFRSWSRDYAQPPHP